MEELRSKFKTVRVEPDKGETTTVTYVQIGGRNERESLQINATWTSLWDSASNPPLLKKIEVSDYDEVIRSLKDGESLYSEATRSVFRDPQLFEKQLKYGIDHWASRFDGAIARPAAGHGLAVGDVNGDGLEDVYL